MKENSLKKVRILHKEYMDMDRTTKLTQILRFIIIAVALTFTACLSGTSSSPGTGSSKAIDPGVITGDAKHGPGVTTGDSYLVANFKEFIAKIRIVLPEFDDKTAGDTSKTSWIEKLEERFGESNMRRWYWLSVEKFMRQILQKLVDDGVKYITEDKVSVSLETIFMGVERKWIIDINLETEPQSIRFFFKDESGNILGTYVVELDDDGYSKRGTFGFLRGVGVPTDPNLNEQVIAFAYDVTEENSKRLVSMFIYYDFDAAQFKLRNNFFEYFPEEMIYTQESVGISTATRAVDPLSLIFSWEINQNSLCIRFTEYDGSSKTEYGPRTYFLEEDLTMTRDICEITEPSWKDAIVSEKTFMVRESDDPVNFTAGVLDKGTEDTWKNMFKSEMATDWTKGKNIKW